MRGAQRKHDYETMRAEWESGVGRRVMCQRYGIGKTALYEIVSRHGWKRPLRPQSDMAAIRAAYERGDVLTVISREHRIGVKRITAIAAAEKWRRPAMARDSKHLEVQAYYEAGLPMDEIARRSGYAPRTIKTLINTYGWLRKEPGPVVAKDPLGDALAKAGYVRHVVKASRWSSSANVPAWGAR